MVGSVEPGLIFIQSTVIFYSSFIPHRGGYPVPLGPVPRPCQRQARLKSSGEEVAIKVQVPNAERMFRGLALARCWVGNSGFKAPLDTPVNGIFDETKKNEGNIDMVRM